MTLQLGKGMRPYKAYVKKLENGFGIKTINTLTGVENIVIITTDSTKGFHLDKKKVDSKHKILRPLFNNFNSETVSATLPIPNINKPKYAINKVIAHIEPYLREIKADIAGFHMFEESNANSSPNVQATSVIFVTNTESARKKGVHLNIPGKLMNMFFVDGQNKEGKIKFKADSVVKPLTIVVSNYVLHINICYDLPSKPQSKTVGTQTKKRYVLSSSVDDNIPVYKLESSLLNDSQDKSERILTQTNSSSLGILTEELQSSQTNLNKHYKDNGLQTVFFTNPISFTSKSSSEKRFDFFGDRSGLNIVEGNTKADSFENSSKQTIGSQNSLNSFPSYDSHTHLQRTTVFNNVKDSKNHRTDSTEHKNIKESIKTPTTSGIQKEKKKTLTLFDNSSNYNTKKTNSDIAFNKIESKSSNSTVNTSTKSASFEEYRSRTSMKTANPYNGLAQLRNIEKSSNVSIKDEKERLNKTTLSLQQLCSVIDMLKKKSDNRSSSETTLQSAGYIEREQLANKTYLTKRTSIVMANRATLGGSTSTDSSDQSVYFPERKLRRNQSSNSTSSEKSFSDYKETTSIDILCERCGSFHTDVGFECDCGILGRTDIKQIENQGSRNNVNRSSSTEQENIVNNLKNVYAVKNTRPDQTESVRSTSNCSNEIQSPLETNVKDSTMSCKEPNYLTMEGSQRNKSNKHEESESLEIDKYDLDNVNFRLSAQVQTIVTYPKEIIQRVVDYDTLKLSEEEFMNIKEFELERDELPIYDHNLAEAFKDDTLSTQSECNGNSNNTNTSNESFISKESIQRTSNSDNSSQTLTISHNTLGEHNKDPPYISSSKNTVLIKVIEEYNAAQKAKVLNTVFLHQSNNYIATKQKKPFKTTTFRNGNKTEAKENGNALYFTDVRHSKSWTSFRWKSLQSCNFNDKIEKLQGITGKTTNSELITNQLNIKNLSSGDHLRENVLCKLSSSLEERLNTIPLLNRKSYFLNNKYSSSSTLHIIPSSLDLLKLKSQESSFQNRELSKKALEKVGGKSPNFVKSIGKLQKGEDTSLDFTTRQSQYKQFQNKFVPNKTINNSKTGQNTTQNKFSNSKKKHNSKHKKNDLFCLFFRVSK